MPFPQYGNKKKFFKNSFIVKFNLVMSFKGFHPLFHFVTVRPCSASVAKHLKLASCLPAFSYFTQRKNA